MRDAEFLKNEKRNPYFDYCWTHGSRIYNDELLISSFWAAADAMVDDGSKSILNHEK
ncbi:hypothetical protein D3C78_1880290 [compost metagenome]